MKALAPLLICFLLTLACLAQEGDPKEDVFIDAQRQFEKERAKEEKKRSRSGVPDLRDLTVSEAEATLLAWKASISVELRKVKSEGPPGLVLDQKPKPGSRVKGSLVLFVSEPNSKAKVAHKTSSTGPKKTSGTWVLGWFSFLVAQVLLLLFWLTASRHVEALVQEELDGRLDLLSSVARDQSGVC